MTTPTLHLPTVPEPLRRNGSTSSHRAGPSRTVRDARPDLFRKVSGKSEGDEV